MKRRDLAVLETDFSKFHKDLASDNRCSRCFGPRESWNQSYCRSCKAALTRAFRLRHSELPAEARRRANARAYANVYRGRGKLIPRACRCGEARVQMHHPDYSRPLDVEWVCETCHRAIHGR